MHNGREAAGLQTPVVPVWLHVNRTGAPENPGRQDTAHVVPTALVVQLVLIDTSCADVRLNEGQMIAVGKQVP